MKNGIWLPIVSSLLLACGCGGYNSRLDSLVVEDYRDAILPPAARQDQVLGEQGGGGLRLGMSMNQVVRIWGRPWQLTMENDVDFIDQGKVVQEVHTRKAKLLIRTSMFEFRDGKLTGMRFHQSDLPGMKYRTVAMGDRVMKALKDLNCRRFDGSRQLTLLEGSREYSVLFSDGRVIMLSLRETKLPVTE